MRKRSPLLKACDIGINGPQALEQYSKADWQAAQYWSMMSGDATALQTTQLLGMVAVLEWRGVVSVSYTNLTLPPILLV